MTCQVASAVSQNISVLRKTIMKGDKIRCKQFQSMFFLYSRANFVQYYDCIEGLASVSLLSGTFTRGDPPNDPECFVHGGGLAGKPRDPSQHTGRWVCARGQQHGVTFPSQPRSVPPPTQVPCGEFPPSHVCPGLPERTDVVMSGFPGCFTGFSCLLEKARKLVCKSSV